MSSCRVFFLCCLVVFGSIGTLYAWLAFMPPNIRAGGGGGMPSFGCQQDSEGSWSVGVFYGDSPFAFKPIETVNISPSVCLSVRLSPSLSVSQKKKQYFLKEAVRNCEPHEGFLSALRAKASFFPPTPKSALLFNLL